MFKASAISATLAVALLGCASGQNPTNTPAESAQQPAAQAEGSDSQDATPVSATESGGEAMKKDGKAAGCGSGGCGAHKDGAAKKDGKAAGCGGGSCGAKADTTKTAATQSAGNKPAAKKPAAKATPRKSGASAGCGAGSCGSTAKKPAKKPAAKKPATAKKPKSGSAGACGAGTCG